jgi:uncharacterized membrane protein
MSFTSPSTDITSDDKLWALLSYILAPVVPIIVLLMEDKKNRPFIKYHAVQGLVLSILGIILGSITVGVLGCVYAIVAIYFAVKAYQGEWISIPWLTDFMKKQGWM